MAALPWNAAVDMQRTQVRMLTDRLIELPGEIAVAPVAAVSRWESDRRTDALGQRMLERFLPAGDFAAVDTVGHSELKTRRTINQHLRPRISGKHAAPVGVGHSGEGVLVALRLKARISQVVGQICAAPPSVLEVYGDVSPDQIEDYRRDVGARDELPNSAVSSATADVEPLSASPTGKGEPGRSSTRVGSRTARLQSKFYAPIVQETGMAKEFGRRGRKEEDLMGTHRRPHLGRDVKQLHAVVCVRGKREEFTDRKVVFVNHRICC